MVDILENFDEFSFDVSVFSKKEKKFALGFVEHVIEIGLFLEEMRDKWKKTKRWEEYLESIGHKKMMASRYIRTAKLFKKTPEVIDSFLLYSWKRVDLFLSLSDDERSDLLEKLQPLSAEKKRESYEELVRSIKSNREGARLSESVVFGEQGVVGIESNEPVEIEVMGESISKPSDSLAITNVIDYFSGGEVSEKVAEEVFSELLVFAKREGYGDLETLTRWVFSFKEVVSFVEESSHKENVKLAISAVAEYMVSKIKNA